ncbi:TPA: DUF2158 domain-containing protein [Proteus mirabilis]|uniref:YodC family protein n=1 Tax=Proteus mirabilis TaxID=584 RepID=UPI0009495D8F|nr:DUF2158 domain-containing protein [Proteus mirabilis]EKX9074379.1 DUF2158 domain-containing protein [Proteus mirabilis]NGX91826.1 DUF2158 domain-containing protein [Proteus mirabilis]CAJ0561823.1 DUF2158 domain-containing protein [Proteus mirabilis]HCQ8940549.1 DUF2158 domain-containing protein [Proteus mirabilis]HCT8726717.1 DUF2158 domain-containing protein [Proteus mirabilis]
MSNFNIGDVVVLKSGGPKMTVSEVRNDNYVTCVWFEDKQTHTQAFVSETLEKED